MIPARAKPYVRFLAVFTLLGLAGLGASLYILSKQRVASPFEKDYTVKAAFPLANGVTSGLGQPVNVAGVKVGQITGVKLTGGQRVVTMEIQRDKVRRVYANATAVLEPITPLKDLQINLDPGRPPARPLSGAAVLPTSRSQPPVPVSDLLSSLDADTRSYLGTLLSSLREGTRGRTADLRRLYKFLGPTTAQVRRISTSLARRRTSLARLVHNLGVVTRAASRDRRLSEVVGAGNQTLEAIARQDNPLRASLEKLPPTLDVTRSTLGHLEPFARELGPTVSALQPSVRRLPATLKALRPFADASTVALKRDIRPFVREAQPLARDLRPTVTSLTATTPLLTRSFQSLTYLVNELAYNAPGNDEGFLFWASWFFHNFNSVVSSGDAHGGIGRAFPLVTCEGLQGMKTLQGVFDVAGVCPQ